MMTENEALKNETDGTGSNSRAVGCFLEKRYEDALAEYRKLAAADPDNIKWQSNIILCLTELRRLDEKDFAAFLKRMDDFCSEAWFCYEDVLEYFGHADEALDVLGEILERDPDNVSAYLSAAELLESLGEGDAYIEVLKDVFPRFKDDERVLCLVAGNASNMGNKAQAGYLFKRALKINRPYTLQSVYFYEYLISVGHEKRAARYAEEALDLVPDNPDVLEAYGVASGLCGEFEKSDGAFKKLESLYGELPDRIKILWADTLSGKKDYERAFNLAESVSEDYAFRDSLFLFQRKVLYYLKFNGGDVSALTDVWMKNHPDNPVVAHTCAALNGNTDAPTPPVEFVREFFDLFAGEFDDTLAQLDYKGVVRADKLLKRADVPENRSWNVLDAGCGTGLIGAVLKKYSAPKGRLTGIDASGRMLDAAREKILYDSLEQADIFEYLPKHPKEFNMICCMDVTPYIADLQPLFNSFSSALAEDGVALLSVLKARVSDNVSEYILQTSGQYAHSLPYVEKALEFADLEIMEKDEDVLRYEMGEPVTAVLYAVRKKQ